MSRGLPPLTTPLPLGNPNIPGELSRISRNKISSFLIRMRNFLNYSITGLVTRDGTFSIHLHQGDWRTVEGAGLSKPCTYRFFRARHPIHEDKVSYSKVFLLSHVGAYSVAMQVYYKNLRWYFTNFNAYYFCLKISQHRSSTGSVSETK